jgi:ankyrin repeat protein
LVSIAHCPKNRHAEIVKMLLERGADANAESYFKHDRPLHLVKTADIVKLLINHGAIVNALDAFGCTPLHGALDADIASVLLENGACPID